MKPAISVSEGNQFQGPMRDLKIRTCWRRRTHSGVHACKEIVNEMEDTWNHFTEEICAFQRMNGGCYVVQSRQPGDAEEFLEITPVRIKGENCSNQSKSNNFECSHKYVN